MLTQVFPTRTRLDSFGNRTGVRGGSVKGSDDLLFSSSYDTLGDETKKIPRIRLVSLFYRVPFILRNFGNET